MSRRLNSSTLKVTAAAIGMIALAGCATDPQKAIDIAKPKTLPQRTLTNFSESIRCMDGLLLQYGRSDMVITSAGIPDETAVISAGTKDMLISAISRMSRKSDAFTFVDYDSTQVDVHELQGLAGFDEDFLIPDFYIRGAITQLDEGVLDKSAGANAGYTKTDFDEESEENEVTAGLGAFVDANQNVAVVSLDLNVGDLTTRQIIPGISAHNSIAVSRTNISGGLAGEIYKLGAGFSINMNRNEGLHQAVRTLIELSTIEVLGKLAEVPFWRCLQIDHTNPAVVAEAREWFDGMDEDEQIAFVQNALATSGNYGGDSTGVMDAATKGAIARYQAQNDLIADGRINFDLYASLLNDEVSSVSAAAIKPVALRTPDIDAAVQEEDADGVEEEDYVTDEEDYESEDYEADEEDYEEDVAEVEDVDIEEEDLAPPIVLELVAKGPTDGLFEVNRELQFSASPSQDAHVYCYYADASGNVARVFPNQFQPDSYLPAGDTVQVPGENAGFDIVLDQSDADEKVACIASPNELALRLPEEIKMPDLTPIPGRSLDDIIAAYRDLEGDEDVALARLDLRVR